MTDNLIELQELIENHKYIIFDFDETLVWLKADWRGHVKLLKEKYPEVIKKYNSTLGKEDVNYIHVRNGIVDFYGKEILPELRKLTEKLETEGIYEMVYNKDLIQLIRDFCGEKDMFIWSGNCTSVIEKVLVEQKINGCFTKIISQDVVTHLKPYPEGFEYIYNKTTPLTDYLMIGDSDNDEAASKAAGIDFFRITYFRQR